MVAVIKDSNEYLCIALLEPTNADCIKELNRLFSA